MENDPEPSTHPVFSRTYKGGRQKRDVHLRSDSLFYAEGNGFVFCMDLAYFIFDL